MWCPTIPVFSSLREAVPEDAQQRICVGARRHEQMMKAALHTAVGIERFPAAGERILPENIESHRHERDQHIPGFSCYP